MRTQTDEEKATSIALAIYRGLPDNERAVKLSEWRQMSGYHARTLVVLCEQHEMSVRVERERLSALEREVQFVRSQLATRTNVQPDIYANVRAEQSRAMFGIGIVIVGVGAAAYAFYTFGVWPVVMTLGVAYFLSKLGSGGGSEQSDNTATTGQSNAGQSININITGHGGQINFSQGQAGQA